MAQHLQEETVQKVKIQDTLGGQKYRLIRKCKDCSSRIKFFSKKIFFLKMLNHTHPKNEKKRIQLSGKEIYCQGIQGLHPKLSRNISTNLGFAQVGHIWGCNKSHKYSPRKVHTFVLEYCASQHLSLRKSPCQSGWASLIKVLFMEQLIWRRDLKYKESYSILSEVRIKSHLYLQLYFHLHF